MKEIKFRAWDKEFKRMVSDLSLHGLEFYGDSLNDALSQTTIMQFTGFKDKIGTDIYEGDIVRVTFDDVMIPINMPVRWYLCGWEPFNGYSDIFMNGYKPSDHLVIGNIYENPEIEYAKTPNDLYLSTEHDMEMIKEGHQRSDRDTRRGE